MPDKPLSEWTDEALDKEEGRLAEQRTSVRLRQIAVAEEKQIRAAMKAMSPSTGRRFRMRLEGESASSGDAKAGTEA